MSCSYRAHSIVFLLFYTNSHTIVFFTVIVMAGMGAGVIENFLFLFIGEVSKS